MLPAVQVGYQERPVLAGSENLNDLRYLLTRVAAVQGRAGEFRGRSYQSVRAAFRLADLQLRP